MNKTSLIKHAIIFFLFAIPLSTYFCRCRQSDSKEQFETDDIELYSDTIPFSIKKNRVIVNTGIEGNSAIPLFLDNGAIQTIIDETYLSKINNKHSIDTLLGMEFPVYKLFSKLKVRLNSFTFEIDTIRIIDFKLFDPSIKYGILGYEFFKDRIVRLSFKDSIIIVSNNLPDTVGYEKFKLYDIANQSVKYFIFKFYKTNDFKEVNVGIDLGSPISFIQIELILDLDDSIKNSIHSKSVFSDMLYKAIVRNKTDLLASSLPDGFCSNLNDLQGLLGIAFLKRFDVIIDDINMYLYIKPIDYDKKQ